MNLFDSAEFLNQKEATDATDEKVEEVPGIVRLTHDLILLQL